ncbi:TetR/AcrR family transcriptional regulator [Nocardia sp. NPDC050412]|uniref:TetR/AcrR family transcriptional regulator n=1 Tax=unclassified Nocardia TaxID=2637762 RepID=UPI0037A1839F
MHIEVESLNGHQARSQLSTRLLLEAAGELVAEGGYASMTLATVGERAGYSRSLATARFGSKTKLLEALVDRIVRRWTITTITPRAEGLSGLDGLMVLLEGIRDQYRLDRRSLRVLYALMFEALGPGQELRERFVELHRETWEVLAGQIRRGIADGSIRAAVDPVVEAQVVVAMLRGVGYQWRLDPEAFDPVPPLDHMIETTRTRLGAARLGA